MPQGQEHSCLEKVTHVTMKVHHTKCTITHTHVGVRAHTHTHIMYNAITQSKKVNQTLPTLQGYGPNKVQEI